jgi:membrane protein
MSEGARSGRRPGRRLELGDFKRAFERFQKDGVTDWAAAMTYYSLMSLFPALLLGVAVLGFFGQEALIDTAAEYLADAGAPRETIEAVTSALDSALGSRSTALTALVVGLATSVYGASGAFGAAGRALNVIFRVQEGRGFIRQKATNILATLIVILFVILTFVLVFLGGGLAGDVFGAIGLGDTVAEVWRIVRWPLALCSAMIVYAVVYYAAPNVEVPHFRWITPGAVVGVLLWLVASAGFFFYVSNFSSYGATYGAFAGAVILLVWLWLTNIVLLYGAELNAVIDLRRSPELSERYDGPTLPERVPNEA